MSAWRSPFRTHLSDVERPWVLCLFPADVYVEHAYLVALIDGGCAGEQQQQQTHHIRVIDAYIAGHARTVVIAQLSMKHKELLYSVCLEFSYKITKDSIFTVI